MPRMKMKEPVNSIRYCREGRHRADAKKYTGEALGRELARFREGRDAGKPYSKGQISNIETGRSRGGLDFWDAAAKLFDVHEETLRAPPPKPGGMPLAPASPPHGTIQPTGFVRRGDQDEAVAMKDGGELKPGKKGDTKWWEVLETSGRLAAGDLLLIEWTNQATADSAVVARRKGDHYLALKILRVQADGRDIMEPFDLNAYRPDYADKWEIVGVVKEWHQTSAEGRF